jgi:hypothetical protein
VRLTDSPLLVFAVCLIVLVLVSWTGALLRGRRELSDESREAFAVVLAAALTLLGLIIGFSFSMAISRYDQRKNYEEAEANAIGTEYVRADLLPSADAALTKQLLLSYTAERVLFYRNTDTQQVRDINERTTRLQNQLWSAVRAPAASSPTPIVALAVSGMNDVLNSQGYTQAAWWNRIPLAAWMLMIAIAMLCNIMLGFREGRERWRGVMIFIMPLIVSISFFLIADIDSPRGGIIRVMPQNLSALQASLNE